MNSLELTDRERALLRKAEKNTHPSYSWKWCLAFLSLPILFVVVGFYCAHRLSEDFEYAFCVRLSDGVFHPLPFSFVRMWDAAIAFIGVFMLIACGLVVHLWRERRLFHSIVNKLGGKSAQP
jgi:hypothetical protein